MLSVGLNQCFSTGILWNLRVPSRSQWHPWFQSTESNWETGTKRNLQLLDAFYRLFVRPKCLCSLDSTRASLGSLQHSPRPPNWCPSPFSVFCLEFRPFRPCAAPKTFLAMPMGAVRNQNCCTSEVIWHTRAIQIRLLLLLLFCFKEKVKNTGLDICRDYSAGNSIPCILSFLRIYVKGGYWKDGTVCSPTIADTDLCLNLCLCLDLDRRFNLCLR